jgi:hypothetical protein
MAELDLQFFLLSEIKILELKKKKNFVHLIKLMRILLREDGRILTSKFCGSMIFFFLVVGGSMSAVLYIQAVQDNSEYDSI